MAKVVITGCGLSLSPTYRFWGDLWEEGDCWIFNACGDEEGMDDPLSPRSKQLRLVLDSHQYFQRRNVFVISKALATLNQVAIDYLNKAPS